MNAFFNEQNCNNSGNYIKYRIYEITKLIWGNVKHSLIQMQSANVMLVAYVLFCIGTMNGGAITTNKIDIQLSSFFSKFIRWLLIKFMYYSYSYPQHWQQRQKVYLKTEENKKKGKIVLWVRVFRSILEWCRARYCRWNHFSNFNAAYDDNDENYDENDQKHTKLWRRQKIRKVSKGFVVNMFSIRGISLPSHYGNNVTPNR